MSSSKTTNASCQSSRNTNTNVCPITLVSIHDLTKPFQIGQVVYDAYALVTWLKKNRTYPHSRIPPTFEEIENLKNLTNIQFTDSDNAISTSDSHSRQNALFDSFQGDISELFNQIQDMPFPKERLRAVLAAYFNNLRNAKIYYYGCKKKHWTFRFSIIYKVFV